jgi:hypothetical protein
VARALRELPEIRRAFSSGQLSFSKVRALTRVAEPDSEERLLELARHATAAQLKPRGSLREAEFEAGGSTSATGSLENGSAEPENQPEYRELGSADALVAIAETALASEPTPLAGPERHQLTPSSSATEAVAFRAATTGAGSTPTTSSTGPMAARPSSRT